MNRKGNLKMGFAMFACCLLGFNFALAIGNEFIYERTANEFFFSEAPPVEGVLPKLNIYDALFPIIVEEGGINTISVEVVLSDVTDKLVSFNYRTIPGTARQGKDYQGVIGTGYIAAGNDRYTITIPILDDNIPESINDFTLEIADPVNALLGTENKITCKITDTDPDPVAYFVRHVQYVSEEDGVALVEIKLDRPSEKKVIVACSAGQKSAKMWKDFTPLLDPYENVAFYPGETLKSTFVKITNDDIPENTEEFSVNLSRLLNCTCKLSEICNIIITDSDHLPSLSINDAEGREGEIIRFKFALSHAAALPVSFNVSTNLFTTGLAAGPDDFIPISNQSVQIPVGATEAWVDVQTLTDDIIEEIETFQMKVVSGIQNARLPGTTILSCKGSIIDSQCKPLLILSDAECREGEQLNFKLRLTSPVNEVVSVNYHTEDISATKGNDYVNKQDVLVIPQGETIAYINIETLKDQEKEDDERIKLVVDDISHGIGICCESTMGTIHDNPFPIAMDDRLVCREDESVNANVLDNDLPGDGVLKVVSNTSPSEGILILSENGMIAFTPPAEYHGEQMITYTIEDEDGDQSSANVSLVVENVNDHPIANDDNYEIEEGESVSDNVLTNDSGLGDQPVVVAFTNPEYGTLNVSNDGTFTYIPDEGYYGEEVFSYRVEDVDGDNSSAFIRIKVYFKNNYAPVAVADVYSTQLNTARNLPVLSNDYDLDGNETIDRQSIQLETLPLHGNATILNGQGEIEYTPANDWIGKDSLQYSVADEGGLRSNAVWVIIEVKEITQAPVAIAKNITLSLDETGYVAIAAEDVDNGSFDPDGQEIFLEVNPKEFWCENIGDNLVTLTVTDSDGLTGTAIATVSVVDELAPEVMPGTCTDEIQIATDPGAKGAVVEYSLPKFSDNCGGDNLEGTLTQGLASGSFFQLGIALIQYEYTDASGNGPAICSFNIKVIDDESPVIECPDNYESCIEGGDQVIDGLSIVASDNITEQENLIVRYTISGATNGNGEGDASGESFNLGESTVTYVVKDAYDNESQCSFKITLYPTPETLPIQPVVP